ncbi:Carboxylesterase 2 [Paraburkholderia domus]|jgi:Predicted esterase|uniref:Carboxylesterase 2 n=1 Tax=Paraburkholderia domus TaxID=2793075 RepID=A0A9N8R6G0_9BURK|nr:alpha/beta hydrolase [Paraburkholderia domus]MBK5053835.1 alpha/beta hydrolase [Burkholderia sp. R-70006]MBK5065514.1 alpha/beta hydrolase [Burkholderia sp. R-70199]MBK5090540.1 alpha/beta hydrolase [Burkholderia sp. R-69927]MBK5169886.1 alpha/beta hydrolase [Burkholderia sp. R-70211]MBK5184840.1 alpha/beta hydrolase [Burkholderia sp. R-69749]MCI0150998.1 alpha/beta hydrolase [Paraburkholderia sediminicola]
MTDQSPTIEIESAPNPRFAVILMHGLGADANDFVSLVPELRLTDAPAVRFVFPNAPEIAVTANDGYVMRAWYDIRSFQSINEKVDEAGIELSCATVRQLIEAQNQRGIPTSNIFLAGFSQGAAMTYSAGLTHPEALAGLIVMSGYVPSPSFIDSRLSAANRSTPIFAAHGLYDEVLPIQLGEAARDFAITRGCKVDWNAYPMPHSVCAEEITALRAWLGALLAASS